MHIRDGHVEGYGVRCVEGAKHEVGHLGGYHKLPGLSPAFSNCIQLQLYSPIKRFCCFHKKSVT